MPDEIQRVEAAEPPSGPVRRLLRGLVLGLIGLFAGYLLAANLLLQTPLVAALTNKRPEKLLITYRWAWTFFPGHVLAYGVSVRNQASRSQLQISADKVWAVANPLPLVHREVRIARGRVHGPRVWLRSRPATVEEQQAAAAFVPPIEGLPFSLRVPRTHPRPSRWTITVAEVEVLDVREFWYQLLRVEGPGTVRGAFTVGPGSLVTVRWDRCDLPALALSYRNEVVLPAAELHSAGEIAPFDSHDKEWADLLRQISGRAELTGTVPDGIGAARPFLAGIRGVTLSGAPLRYAALVRMDEGVLEPGTRIELSSSRAEAGYENLRGCASIRLGATVREEASAPVLVLDLALDAPRLGLDCRDPDAASAHALALAARLPEFSLTAAPRRLTYALSLADLRLEDALDLPPRREGRRAVPRLELALPGSTNVLGEVVRDADGAISARWGPLEVAGLTATLDGRPIVTEGRLTSSGSVGPVARGGSMPGSWLATLGGLADLDLLVGPDLAALDPLLGSRDGFALSGGPVRLGLKAEVENGRPLAGSTLTLRTDRAGIHLAEGLPARGAIDLRATLSSADSGAADVVLRGFDLRLPAAGGTTIRSDSVVLKASAAGVSLDGLPEKLGVAADLSGLRLNGALGSRALAVAAPATGAVRVAVDATTARDGTTLLRWGPLEIPALAVRLDGQPLLDELRLETSGTLGPITLTRGATPEELLAATTGRLQLDAVTPAGLATARGLLPPDAGLELGGDAARCSADVSLERGSLVPGSRIDLRTDALEVTASDVAVRAAVDLSARIEEPVATSGNDGAPRESELALETTLSGIRVSHRGAPGAAGQGASLVLSARAPLGALQGPRQELEFALAMTDLRFQELTRLDDPLPRGVQDDIGPDDLRLDAAVHGDARLGGRLAFGPGRTFELDCDTLEIPHFDLDVDGTALFSRAALAGEARLGPYDFGAPVKGGLLPVTSGRATITARTAAGLRAIDNLLKSVEWLDFEGGVGYLTLAAVVEKGELKPGSSATLLLGDLALKVADFRAGGDADVQAWIARDEQGELGSLAARLSDVRVSRAGTTGTVEAEGVTLTARTRDLRLGKSPREVDVEVALHDARLDTIVGLNGLLPAGTGVRFTDGSLRVDAELAGTSGGKDGHGWIRGRGDDLTISAPGYDLSGDVALDVPLSDGDLREGRFRIDGATIDLRNFSVAGGETGSGDWTSAWWADIGVDDADLVLTGEIAADGAVSFRMRDTAPLVQFFTSRTRIPRFLARALVVNDVSGRADLTYGLEQADVRDLEVVSDRAQAKARLRIDQKKPAGQLLVVYGWLGLGIGLDGQATDLRLFGARHWYARLGPDPPADLDAHVDEEIRAWRERRRELREAEESSSGDPRH